MVCAPRVTPPRFLHAQELKGHGSPLRRIAASIEKRVRDPAAAPQRYVAQPAAKNPPPSFTLRPKKKKERADGWVLATAENPAHEPKSAFRFRTRRYPERPAKLTIRNTQAEPAQKGTTANKNKLLNLESLNRFQLPLANSRKQAVAGFLAGRKALTAGDLHSARRALRVNCTRSNKSEQRLAPPWRLFFLLTAQLSAFECGPSSDKTGKKKGSAVCNR